MSGYNSARTPPANDPVQDADGRLADTWRAHFQEIADLAGSVWQVGDYKQAIQPDLGPNWLLCDGRLLNDADYPDLAALLKAGASDSRSGQFRLPTVAAGAAGDGTATVQTWVRGL